MTASNLCPPIFRRPHSATRRLHRYRGTEQAGHGVRGGAVGRGEGEGQVPSIFIITKICSTKKYLQPRQREVMPLQPLRGAAGGRLQRGPHLRTQSGKNISWFQKNISYSRSHIGH